MARLLFSLDSDFSEDFCDILVAPGQNLLLKVRDAIYVALGCGAQKKLIVQLEGLLLLERSRVDDHVPKLISCHQNLASGILLVGVAIYFGGLQR